MGRERLNDIDCFGCGEGVGEQIFGSDKVSYEIIFDRKKQQIYMSRKKKFNFFLVLFVVFSIISCGLIYLYYPLHQEYTQYSIFDLSDQTINEIDKSSFRGVFKITLGEKFLSSISNSILCFYSSSFILFHDGYEHLAKNCPV